jgi:hypothetical protein
MTINTTNLLKIKQIGVERNGAEYIDVIARAEDEYTLRFMRSNKTTKLVNVNLDAFDAIVEEIFEKLSIDESFNKKKSEVRVAVFSRLESAITAFTAF